MIAGAIAVSALCIPLLVSPATAASGEPTDGGTQTLPNADLPGPAQRAADKLWNMQRAGLEPQGAVAQQRFVGAEIAAKVERSGAPGQVAAAPLGLQRNSVQTPTAKDLAGTWSNGSVVISTTETGFKEMVNGDVLPDSSTALVENVEPLDATESGQPGGIRPLSVIDNWNNSIVYRRGYCPAYQVSHANGREEGCWWKYRAADSSTALDYWPYAGAAIAIPAAIPLASDPFVLRARTGSQMEATYRTNMGYRGFVDHAPRSGMSGNCQSINVGVSYGPAQAGVNGVALCDDWTTYTNGTTANKYVTFETGVLVDRGRDMEVAHASLSETRQRTATWPVPSWSDVWWSTICTTRDSCL